MSADTKLKAYIDRILRCREAEDEAKKDTKSVYAELAGEGYEKSVVGQVVNFLRKREKDGDKLTEQSAKFDLDLDAYDRPSHAYARVRDGEDANPRLIKQVVDGMQTEAGRAALSTAVDIMIEREEADELRSDAGLSIVTKHTEITSSPETATEQRVNVHSQHEGANAQATVQNECVTVVGTESGTVAISEKATVATQGEATAPTSDERVSPDEGGSAAANAGGNDVESGAERANHLVTGEGEASAALPNTGFAVEYVPPFGMKRLPFAGCFPDLSKAEYDRLEKNIAANRIQTPIIRQGDVIVDGWNRYTIARKYGFAYPVHDFPLSRDVLLDVIDLQRASRNFTPAQEKKIAADLAKEFPQRADEIMTAFGLVEAMEAAE